MWLIRRITSLPKQCWLRFKSTFRMLVLLKKQLCVRLTRAILTAMQRKKPVSIRPVSVHMIRHIYACVSARMACLDLASVDNHLLACCATA